MSWPVLSSAAATAGLFAAATVLFTSPAARAGGYELVQQAASSGGTAHASTARIDDASAAWFNPAALADGKGFRGLAGIAFAGSTIRAHALETAADAPWEASTINPIGTPPQLYLSFSNAWWAAGATVNLPFAGGVTWPDAWPGRFEILSSQPRFFRFAAFFAASIGPVSFSAGPHLDAGSLGVLKATDHVAEEGSAELSVRGLGLGGHGSILVRIGDVVQIGASYKSRTRLALAGEADFDVPLAYQSRFPDQPVAAVLTLPDRIAVGARVEAGPVAILFDTTVTLWSVNDELVFDFEDPVTADTRQVSRWRDSMALRLGAEWTAPRILIVRAGAYVDGIPGAPAPADTLAPSSPDSTRLGFTVGLGARPVAGLQVDLFYEHIELLPREAAGDDAPLAGYRGFANVLGVSVQAGPFGPNSRRADAASEAAGEGPGQAGQEAPGSQ